MKTTDTTSHTGQNRKIIAVFAGMLLVAGIITSCVVTSVYPYYHAKDVTFDEALLGKWIPADETNSNSDEFWTFEKINERTYKLTTFDNKTNQYDAVLFQLGGATFLDCLPRERGDCTTPNHILLRVESIQPQFKMVFFDYAWLSKLIEKEPRAIRHIIVPNEAGTEGGSGNITLTAETFELQRFILKHLETKEAWAEPLVMERSKPSVNIPAK